MYLGIDLGTSGARALLIDGTGAIRGEGKATYPLLAPRNGWAEQEPEAWWGATIRAVRAALDGHNVDAIRAIGPTGQMHGTVLVDDALRAIRPAIIWPDRRTAGMVASMGDAETLEVHRIGGSPAAAGMFGITLAWLSAEEAESLERARWALLPKDYLRARMIGSVATDPSDASGSLLIDVAGGGWSPTLLAQFGVDAELLPPMLPSEEIAGVLSAEAAAALGLPVGVPVVTGASDQATAALSLGLGSGVDVAIGISSGGTVLTRTDRPEVSLGRGVHTMVSADGGWLRMGAILSAGLALDWVARLVGGGALTLEELLAEASDVAPGSEGVTFLPSLRGERTPTPNPAATASIRNLSFEHGRPEIVHAVLEGVAFGLRECVEATVADLDTARVAGFGGGFRSDVWGQIVADTLARSITLLADREHSAFGAALLAARGVGVEFAPDLRGFREIDPVPAHAAATWGAFRRFAEVRGTIVPA